MKISEKIITALPAPESGNIVTYFSGASIGRHQAPNGFGIRTTAAGIKSFVWLHRVDGRRYLETIARWPDVSVEDAIVAVKERVKSILKGEADPLPKRMQKNKTTGLTVNGLLDKFMERYVQNKLRSEVTIKQCLDRLVRPHIGKLDIHEVRRSDINKMLDAVADSAGEVQADRILGYVRTAFNFHEVRGGDDDFGSPIVRGMSRTNPLDHARERVLTEQNGTRQSERT